MMSTFLFNAVIFFVKTRNYITHNATLPHTFSSEIWVCYDSSGNLAKGSFASSWNEETATEVEYSLLSNFTPPDLFVFPNLRPSAPNTDSSDITAGNFAQHLLEPQKVLYNILNICSSTQNLCT